MFARQIPFPRQPALAAIALLLLISGPVLFAALAVPGANAGNGSASRPSTTNSAYLPYLRHNFPWVIHIQGRVILADGTGLPDIDIYTGVLYAPVCGGLVTTTTGPDGSFDSSMRCPYDHDETLHVCPLSDAYTFEPAVVNMRTYGYCPTLLPQTFIATPLNHADR